jgi:riboflavin kinase
LDYKTLRIISGLDEGESKNGPESHRINGFERDGKSFGGATAFRAKISKDKLKWIDCAILIPDLTRHVKTAEIISTSFLRESLPCKDGDEIHINLI